MFLIFTAVLIYLHDRTIVEYTEQHVVTPIVEEALQSKVKRLINEYDIKFPRVVYAQIRLETADLTSPVFRDCNNLTGMKHNPRGLSKGICRLHAKYASIEDCIKDYKLWQDARLYHFEKNRNFRPSNDLEYIEMLIRSNYAEDRFYRNKLINLLNN